MQVQPGLMHGPVTSSPGLQMAAFVILCYSNRFLGFQKQVASVQKGHRQKGPQSYWNSGDLSPVSSISEKARKEEEQGEYY